MVLKPASVSECTGKHGHEISQLMGSPAADKKHRGKSYQVSVKSLYSRTGVMQCEKEGASHYRVVAEVGRNDLPLPTSSDAPSHMNIISVEVTFMEELQHLSMPDGGGTPPLPPSRHLPSAQSWCWTEDLIHNKCRVASSHLLPTSLGHLMLSQSA